MSAELARDEFFTPEWIAAGIAWENAVQRETNRLNSARMELLFPSVGWRHIFRGGGE